MKSIRIYLFSTIILVLLASCEKEIVFNGQISAPLVVVNSYISPDSLVAVHVSESRFFLNDTTTFNNINNADVSVLVNGVFIEKMRYTDNGLYTGTHKCAVGESIKLSVKIPTKDEVTCEDKVLAKAEFLSLDTASTLISSYYNTRAEYDRQTIYYDTVFVAEQRSYKFKLKLKDNGNEKNYYRINIVLTQEMFGVLYSFNVDLSDNVDPLSYSTDPTNVGVENNTYNIFSDDIFNGKEVTIKCNFENGYSIYNPKYKNEGPTNSKFLVSLQQISKDYYLYLKTRSNSGGVSLFSEPVQIHNNIQGGLGIFGSYSNNVKIILLQP